MARLVQIILFDLGRLLFYLIAFFRSIFGIRLRGLHLLFQELELLLRQGINVEEALRIIAATPVTRPRLWRSLVLGVLVLALLLMVLVHPGLVRSLVEVLIELFDYFVSVIVILCIFWFMFGWWFSPSPVRVRAWAGTMLRAVRQGNPLSQAVLHIYPTGNRFHAAVIKAGEESGDVVSSLEWLARYERALIRLRPYVLRYFWYPFGLLLGASGIILFSTQVMVPKFVDILSRLGADFSADAPVSYGVLIFFGQWFDYVCLGVWVLFILHLCRVPVLFWFHPLYWRLQRTQKAFHLLLPLSILLRAGLPLERTLESLSFVRYLRRPGWLRAVQEKIAQGTSLSRALEHVPFISEEFRQRIGWAERAETLPEELVQLSRICHEEVNEGYRALQVYMAPIMHLVISILLGIFVYAMYYPIFLIPIVILRG